MKRLKDDGIKFLDLQFTGLFGRFHHTTIDSKMFRIEDFTDGLPKLDGSSIRGFTEIHESDLIHKAGPFHLCDDTLDRKGAHREAHM